MPATATNRPVISQDAAYALLEAAKSVLHVTDVSGKHVTCGTLAVIWLREAVVKATTPPMRVQVGDFVRKDGAWVEVTDVHEENRTLYTSDGGCMSDDELGPDDLRLASEM